MKRIYFSLLLCCGLALLLSSCSSPLTEKQGTVVNGIMVPSLLPRGSATGIPEETRQLRDEYDKSLAAIKADPEGTKPFLDLASVFILEGRITGNGGYYSNAAVRMLDQVLNGGTATQDERFQALSLKSAVLLNMHQFRQALEVAQEGLRMNDFNAGIYGALVDAYVELGMYPEAVASCDKMLSIRPDLRSYSRASYLRQIHGDNAGAVEAMKLAVQAGVPGAEPTEWARVTLGDLYLNTGHADSASLAYRTALVYRPEYAYARMGLARVERSLHHYDAAIAHARTAIKTRSESSFIAYLGELYELKGDRAGANKVRQDVVRLLEEGEQAAGEHEPIRHNANRELATAYLDAGNYEKALDYARKDLALRPDNIDANELTAWICYRQGDLPMARTYAEKALATHSRSPLLLYRTGTILAAAGLTEQGNKLRSQSLGLAPWLQGQPLIAAKP